MELHFKSRELQKQAGSFRELVRAHGEHRARLIRRRLDELDAATVLADIATLPGPRCHELHGNFAGVLSVDLDHPYRLLFRPLLEPPPCRTDGGLDWGRVMAILILGIEDTHG
ncbi:MAG: killer suppression protein [Holophagales bacterium]|nr:killer suppression protein [Holophagales bacterium]